MSLLDSEFVAPPETAGTVELELLDGGSFTGTYNVLHAHSPATAFRMYAWCFHIHHRPSGRHIIWDVGLSANPGEYTAFSVKHCLEDLKAVSPRLSLPQQLYKRGVSPSRVDAVIFSHHHWDHSRPIAKMFPEATGYFGPGTVEHCTPGRFHDDEYHPEGKWDAHFFHPTKKTEKCTELDGEWQPFGYFEQALDYFRDGSFWVIRAPGHMAGNLVAAAKVPSGDWIILGSDCCHSRDLLDGKAEIAVWKTADGHDESLHEDLASAKKVMAKIRDMEVHHGFNVALAHDSTWMLAGENKVLMSLLDDDLKDFAKDRLALEGFP